MRIPIRRAAIGAIAAVLMVLAACGDDDSAAETTGSETTAETSPTTVDAPVTTDGDAATATTTTAAVGPTFDVVVVGDDITGGGRKDVSLGDTVTLRVTSDVDEEVHLHGYDISVDVGAGETAELTFDATIPGIFEAEFENAGLQLIEFEIK